MNGISNILIHSLIIHLEVSIKMKESNLQQWLLFKGGAVFLMVFSMGYIYFTMIYMEVFDTYSLIRLGDVIEYNGKVIICVSGIPIIVLVFFFSLRILLKKGVRPLNKPTALGRVWGVFSMASISLGFIASLIIPFILMASPYTPCNEDGLRGYYVINPDLCKTIVPDHWLKK